MRYRATYSVPLEVVVEVEAEDEDTAAESSWEQANTYLDTLMGDHRGLTVAASLDGIGADTLDEVSGG